MSRERAKTFADRLPDVVPRVEEDISGLDDAMVDVLYPGRRPRPFRFGLVFDAFDGPGRERAEQLARSAPSYRTEGPADAPRHHAEFTVQEAGALRELYQLVGERPGTDVLVDGKAVPYARELWLPLAWFFVREDA